MKVTMVIPSYWGRAGKSGWREGDAVFDHPTPLDAEGTLRRAIQSLAVLKASDFQLVVIAVATAGEIESRVEQKVAETIKAASLKTGVEVLSFGASHLREINRLLVNNGQKDSGLLKLSGYSDVRNMCLFVPHILGSEVAVLIDDDEVFEDPEFMTKATEFIGREVGGRTVHAVAGYYLQPDGDFHTKKQLRPWEEAWGQYPMMNQAFDRFIAGGPRLKEVPFVFGGNMVIHRDLFTVVPFDPSVTRGEDIDFLINARMFGFTFFLDNRLAIKHLPPPKTHPGWQQLRQDIQRFVYEKAKIDHQKPAAGMRKVRAAELDPYPGGFLKDDLPERVERSCRLLSAEYIHQGDTVGAEESLNNIALARAAVPRDDPFRRLCQTQRRWRGLMRHTAQSEVRLPLKEIIEGR